MRLTSGAIELRDKHTHSSLSFVHLIRTAFLTAEMKSISTVNTEITEVKQCIRVSAYSVDEARRDSL